MGAERGAEEVMAVAAGWEATQGGGQLGGRWELAVRYPKEGGVEEPGEVDYQQRQRAAHRQGHAQGGIPQAPRNRNHRRRVQRGVICG